MRSRIDYAKAAPGAYAAMRGLETYVRQSGLEQRLLDLVKTRASQINDWNRLSIAFATIPGSYRPERSSSIDH